MSNVPALPFTVVEGGPQGEDVDIPTDTTGHTKSRSTPEHINPRIDHANFPPGLQPRVNVDNNVRQQQLNFSVRQEIAAIEQRLEHNSDATSTKSGSTE